MGAASGEDATSFSPVVGSISSAPADDGGPESTCVDCWSGEETPGFPCTMAEFSLAGKLALAVSIDAALLVDPSVVFTLLTFDSAAFPGCWASGSVARGVCVAAETLATEPNASVADDGGIGVDLCAVREVPVIDPNVGAAGGVAGAVLCMVDWKTNAAERFDVSLSVA